MAYRLSGWSVYGAIITTSNLFQMSVLSGSGAFFISELGSRASMPAKVLIGRGRLTSKDLDCVALYRLTERSSVVRTPTPLLGSVGQIPGSLKIDGSLTVIDATIPDPGTVLLLTLEDGRKLNIIIGLSGKFTSLGGYI
jgi:hypothetical protein